METLERRRDELIRRLHGEISQLSREEQELFPLVAVDNFNNNNNNNNDDITNTQSNIENTILNTNYSAKGDINNKTRMKLIDFANHRLTKEDYELIQQLQHNKALNLKKEDISRIISDNKILDQEKQKKNDDNIIKSGSGNPLYKEAMSRQNTRLAEGIIEKNINDNLSYDDFMPIYKSEDTDDEEDNIFELMYSQARLKGIRLRDHPSFVDAVMNLLEEASELDRLNSNITDGRRVESQEEIISQIYHARNDRQGVDFDNQHLLYNRSLEDLNTLFLNGGLSDAEEIEYLKLRQEAFDLQMREATGWK